MSYKFHFESLAKSGGNCRTLWAERGLRRPSVQLLPQNRLASEFRPGCSGLFPAAPKGRCPTISLGSQIQYLNSPHSGMALSFHHTPYQLRTSPGSILGHCHTSLPTFFLGCGAPNWMHYSAGLCYLGGAKHFTWSYWLRCCWYDSGCCWPSLLPGSTAGLCSTCCPQVLCSRASPGAASPQPV